MHVIRISAWNLPDPKPTEAQVNALSTAAAVHVEARKAETTTWTRRERALLELLYQINQQTTNAMSRAQFRARVQTVFESLPENP